jgi:RNA polymerase sigma-70 factor (ECF subfamily)
MKLRQARSRTTWLQRWGWTVPGFERPPDADAALDLESALDELTPALRAAFVLREVQGYSYEEVADLLGISAGTARVRVLRARRALSALLEGY